jgi:hypothetical protein
MYKSLYRPSEYLIFPVGTNTVIFNNDICHEKGEIKNLLKIGDVARFIFSFKKLLFKNNELSVCIELLQIEI